MLFSKETGPWQTRGFYDLNNFRKAVPRHEQSRDHIQASVSLKTFGNVRVDCQINTQHRLAIGLHNETVKKNRAIVERLINVVCHLGIHEEAFRGHDEGCDSDNRGIYTDTVHLLSEYDPLLKQHLDEATVFSGLSNRIQNDLIEAIGNVMIEEIKLEINDASFIAISLDEATDVRNLAQLSTVFRFVTKGGEVQERFIGFSDVSEDRGAAALAALVFGLLADYKCESKLVAQTYDGASVMSGHLTGLQARVKEKCPDALFVHCVAHRLNLVLSQALQNSSIKECKVFLKTLSGLSAYFGNSTKRTVELDREVKKRFPKVAPTRWNYNGRLVETLYEHRVDLIAMFEGMLEDPDRWDADELLAARGFLHFLQDFTSNFLLAILSVLFALTDAVFQTIQTKTNDITYCLQSISGLKENLRTKRDEFPRFWEKAKEMSPNEPGSTRMRLADVGGVEASYRKLFYEIIDNVSQQIDARFNDLNRLSFLGLIDPQKSRKYSKDFPEEAFQSLRESYGKYFEFPRLRSELIALYCTKQTSDKGLTQLLAFLPGNDLVEVFPQTFLLCRLIATIPATSVSVERSFSTLKRIKTYARNATGQTRLTHLSLMSIEKSLLQSLRKPEKRDDFNKRVLDEFLKKSRRIELIYK